MTLNAVDSLLKVLLLQFRSWRAGSVVKSTNCSSGESWGFKSHTQHTDSPPSVTPVPQDLTPSSGFHSQNTHTNEIYSKNFLNYILNLFGVSIYTCTHTCIYMYEHIGCIECLEVKRQLVRVCFLLLPCEFWGIECRSAGQQVSRHGGKNYLYPLSPQHVLLGWLDIGSHGPRLALNSLLQ